jgi:hypothetical protein
LARDDDAPRASADVSTAISGPDLAGVTAARCLDADLDNASARSCCFFADLLCCRSRAGLLHQVKTCNRE